jgi:hypothetical protein
MMYIVVSTITDDVKTYAYYRDMIADIQKRSAYSYRILVHANGEYRQLDHQKYRYA